MKTVQNTILVFKMCDEIESVRADRVSVPADQSSVPADRVSVPADRSSVGANQSLVGANQSEGERGSFYILSNLLSNN
jgi:hypothetical protein